MKHFGRKGSKYLRFFKSCQHVLSLGRRGRNICFVYFVFFFLPVVLRLLRPWRAYFIRVYLHRQLVGAVCICGLLSGVAFGGILPSGGPLTAV